MSFPRPLPRVVSSVASSRRFLGRFLAVRGRSLPKPVSDQLLPNKKPDSRWQGPALSCVRQRPTHPSCQAKTGTPSPPLSKDQHPLYAAKMAHKDMVQRWFRDTSLCTKCRFRASAHSHIGLNALGATSLCGSLAGIRRPR